MFSSYELDEFILSIIKQQGLNAHQIDTYNDFLENGIRQIMEELFQTHLHVDLNNKHNDGVKCIDAKIIFKNIERRLPKLSYRVAGNPDMMLPSTARITNANYMVDILYTMHITLTISFISPTVESITKDILISDLSFSLPSMVKSKSCHLYTMSIPELIELDEDPLDIGGYFALNGQSWIVAQQESKRFNHPHYHSNVGYEREVARAEIICKEGDAYEHSSEFILKLNNAMYITGTFTSNGTLKSFSYPIYLIYRLFGMVRDDNLIESITCQSDSKNLRSRMEQILKISLSISEPPFTGAEKELIPSDIILFIATRMFGDTGTFNVPNARARQQQNIDDYRNGKFMQLLDSLLFPHIGKTPASRMRKLHYLSRMIFEIMCVYLHATSPTDRDSYVNKRIHSTGTSLAKTFKQIFNLYVLQPGKNKLLEKIDRVSYANLISTIDSDMRAAVTSNKLEKTLMRSIMTGSEEIQISSHLTMSNRLLTELLHRRNNLNIIAAQRTVRMSTVGASKQDARANDMRMVHHTQLGYICPVQTPDTGGSVGVIKQLAIATIISFNHSSDQFKQFLLSDPAIIQYDDVLFTDVQKHKITTVYVNGNPVAYTVNASDVAVRYREYRRGFRFDFTTNKYLKSDVPLVYPHLGILWDIFRNHLYFYTDHGRMLKPLLLVRNNDPLVDPVGYELYYKDDKSKKFVQNIVLQRKDFNRSISELIQNGIIEYVSHDELDNLLISIDCDELYRQQHNELLMYTHCNIPCTDYGWPTLTCPFASCNQAPRITFQTSQTKQTVGIPTLNRHSYMDKHMLFATGCQQPLVRTIVNDLLYPNGTNEMVAVMARGCNQEDSLEVNCTSIRRGLFQCTEESRHQYVLELNEHWGRAERKTVVLMNANYDKLQGGIVPPLYTRITSGDVIIAKYMDTKDGPRDTSEIHRDFEDIVITAVIFYMTSDNRQACKIKYYKLRVCSIGNKFSSRHGQKGSVSAIINRNALPFTSNGLVPDKIINSFAYPARMTIGQILEGVFSTYAAATGTFIYGNIFQYIDHRKLDSTLHEKTATLKQLGDKLKHLGYNRWSESAMYDGITGFPIDGRVSFAPTYYQSLPKFGLKEMQASHHDGPISAISHQPLEGKSNDGGLRVGEMEKDVICAAGASAYMMETFRENSDGYYIYVCKRCKQLVNYNEKKKVNVCNTCKPRMPDVVRIKSTWTSKNLIQYLGSSMINVDLYTDEFKL